MGLPRAPKPPKPPRLPKWLRWLEPLREPRVWVPVLVVLTVLALAVVLSLVTGNWLSGVLLAFAVALIVLAIVLFRMLFHREREQRLDRGIDDRSQDLEAERARSESVRGLEDGFRRAVDDIRRSRLGGGGVQELPWVLVMGEAGSGKSALLRESGLELPAEYALSLGTGATRHCDWWLANDAVMLDTAGRLLTDDDPRTRDEWDTLLRLTRRARPDCAINGLVVCVPVTTLLGRSPAEIEEQALTLRRRINELEDELGVDFPIYLVVTKADLIEGWVDAANALPPERRNEVLGWTNDQREFADAGEIIARGLGEMCERFEQLAPEMVAVDPDADRRRRLFFFPQELREAVRAVTAFASRAFAPSRYDEIPFLRGVYFTSARREGTAFSPLLHRLGHDWARSRVDGSVGPGGLFTRDLFGEVIVGDASLAVPASSFGPGARRLVHLLAGFLAVSAIAWWSYAFFTNWSGVRRLDVDAGRVVAAASSLESVDRLRRSIRSEADGLDWTRRGGLGGRMERALERARRSFTWAFDREFEHPTKTKLMADVRGYDDQSFEALAQLAVDVTWLANRANPDEAARPDLSRYAPIGRSEEDRTAFREGYDDFVRWIDADAIRVRVKRERDVVGSAAGQLLEIGRLESWSNRSTDAYPPARYSDVGIRADSADAARVSGAYTRRAYVGLVSGLMDAIRETSSVASEKLEQFRRSYEKRYEQSWRSYLLEVPLRERREPEVMKSPYLAFVDQLYENTGIEFSGPDGQATAPPDWVATLREVRRETPLEGEETPPPWQRYRDALDQVSADVVAAQQQGGLALQMALDMSEEAPGSFRNALDLVDELVPRQGDPRAAVKLREVLSMPILDGASAVLALARDEIEQRWRDRVAAPFAGSLDSQGMQALYGPDGELHRFETESLSRFYADGRARPVLGKRGMQLGPGFLAWLASANRVRTALYPTGVAAASPQIAVRLEGVPSKVLGGGPIQVSRREIRMECADGPQVFRYVEGIGSKTFQWSPDCTEVSLRVWALVDGSERELRPRHPSWTGPMALPNFLKADQPEPGRRIGWTLRYQEPEAEVLAVYQLRGDDGILRIAHTRPPAGLAE